MRRLISVMLLAAFCIVAFSGIQLHLPAHGSPHNYGLPEYADNFLLKRLHEWAGYLLVLLAAVHLALNRRALAGYVVWKNRRTNR